MMKRILTFVSHYWPTGLTLAVVLYATLFPDPLPDEANDLFFPGLDKLIHAVMMGGLVAAVAFDRYRAGGTLNAKVLAWIVVGVMLFGVADEAAQTLMGLGRSADVYDWMADAGGAIIAAVTAPPVIRRVITRRG